MEGSFANEGGEEKCDVVKVVCRSDIREDGRS